MSELLNKETVKRVEKSLRDFDKNLKIIALDETARTAKDAASSLKCELGAIVKSLVFKAEGMPLIKSSEIKPLPYFFAMSPCNQAPADAASKIDILLSPTKLVIIPAKTSPEPITASSLVVCKFFIIFLFEPINVVLPFNKMFDLHNFKNFKTFSLFSKLFFIEGNSR